MTSTELLALLVKKQQAHHGKSTIFREVVETRAPGPDWWVVVVVVLADCTGTCVTPGLWGWLTATGMPCAVSGCVWERGAAASNPFVLSTGPAHCAVVMRARTWQVRRQ